MDRWFPVARSEEVIPRHVVQTQLLGQEIAVWRDQDGAVNAWANRCPHRGVRLSIGINTGSELRCRYHGWRFASGSGQCTFIPAHPRQKPASAMRTVVYGAVERHRYVWVSLGGHTQPPVLPRLATERATTLRSVFVEAPSSAVAEFLLRGYRIDATTAASVVANDAFTLTATAHAGVAGDAATVIFLLQPVTASQSVIHGLLRSEVAAADRLAVLRHHNARMTTLRADVERRL